MGNLNAIPFLICVSSGVLLLAFAGIIKVIVSIETNMQRNSYESLELNREILNVLKEIKEQIKIAQMDNDL